MTRNALFVGAALAAILSAPALAQDAMAPAQDPAAVPPAAEAQAEQTLTLQPGAPVVGSDGSALGTLEGVSTGDDGQQQLTVRGSDGQIRGVPVAGISQQGANIAVGWTSAEFASAEIIAEGDAGVTPAPAPEAPATDAAPEAEAPLPTDPSTSAPEPMTEDPAGVDESTTEAPEASEPMA